MSFVIQRVIGRQISLSEVRTDVLRIGRGTNAELRSDNPAVALEHAIIEGDAAGYAVTDKGSITGTYVNGKPVETARLVKGDVIEVGDLRIEVQVADANKPLFLRLATRPKQTAAVVEEEEEEDAAPVTVAPGSGKVVRATKIDYADVFRLRRVWLTKRTLIALGLIAALVAIAEITKPEKRTAFMPGGLSSAHARKVHNGKAVGTDCAACHAPWNSVKDERCTACHLRARHAENEKDPLTCMACHQEHRDQPKLVRVDDQRCTSCHANLAPHVKAALTNDSIRSITDFGKDHPELTSVADPNNIRFNHKLHLRKGGIQNASGKREELTCNGCHKLVVTGDKADPVRLEFEQHCQRCHPLTFDARFPKEELPHGGDPRIVYGYIVNIYSGNLDIVGKSPAERGRLLARGAAATPSAAAFKNARQVVKSKCVKCHDLQTRGGREMVDPPQIVTDWMPGSRFTHTAHRDLDCESCHHGLRDSVKTADVHMPKRAGCTSCHAAGAGVDKASSCQTCHLYHVRSKPLLASALPIAGAAPGTSGGEPRMIDQIVLITITILILVVLIPVGIALFQRLTRKSDDRPAAAAPRPAPPPLPKTPPMPAPPPPAAAKPAPPPPAASFSAPQEATRVTNLSDAQTQGASGSTDFMEWYGMLLCTGGPLKDQRFVIEPDGLYIGRDAGMAQVVINDSRVSKRHVRIVPRGSAVWAIDAGSTNGTFIGSSTSARITEVQLKRGDTIILADNAATFVYQI